MAVEEVGFKLPRSASLYCPENKGFRDSRACRTECLPEVKPQSRDSASPDNQPHGRKTAYAELCPLLWPMCPVIVNWRPATRSYNGQGADVKRFSVPTSYVL